MKIILMCLITSLLFVGILPIIHAENVPEWVKNTSGWWAADAISEKEFVNAIEFLIKEGIINVSSTSDVKSQDGVPDWVKNTAGWWAADAISETEFLNAIVYLIKVGIIHVATPNQENNSCEFEHIPVLNNLNQQQKIAVCKSAQIDYLSERLDCSPCDAVIKYNSNGFRGL